jgi:hypothetical protein
VFLYGKQAAPPFYKVEKGDMKMKTEVSFLVVAFLYTNQWRCVSLQEQVEALYNLSILYDINGIVISLRVFSKNKFEAEQVSKGLGRASCCTHK